MRTRVAGAVLLTAALANLGVGAAHGEGDFQVEGVVMDADGGQFHSAVRLAGLYPTASRSGVLFFDGDKARAVRTVQVGVSELVDQENGCIHPETTTGDTSCTADGGELSDWLRIRTTPGRESAGPDRSCRPDYGASVEEDLQELAAHRVDLRVPEGDSAMCLLVTFTHEEGPGDNVTQTDSATFDIDIGLTELVLAETAQRPSQHTELLGSPSGDDRVVTPSVIDAGLSWGQPEKGLGVTAFLPGVGMLLASTAMLLLAWRRTGRAPAPAHRRSSP